MHFKTKYKKQTKNNYKVATIAAVALVALLIPAGIFATNYYSDGSANIVLSDTEGLAYLAAQANANGNPADAAYYAETMHIKQGDVNAATQLRDAYSQMGQYAPLLPAQKSLITIETSSDIVMFYPEKDGVGYVIPKENPNDNDDSFLLNYPGSAAAPVIYPVDGKYPTVIFDRNDLDAPPVVIGTNDPNYSEIVSQAAGSPDKIVVNPAVKIDPQNKITYAETPLGESSSSNDGPLVVYPHGFDDDGDVPVIVFASQQNSVATVISNEEPYQNLSPENDYGQVYLIAETAKPIVTANDLVPVRYVEVNSGENMETVSGNSPTTVSPLSPEGAPGRSVDFPLGIDSTRPVISVSHESEQLAANVATTSDDYASSSDPTSENYSGLSTSSSATTLSSSGFSNAGNPTFAVTDPAGSIIIGETNLIPGEVSDPAGSIIISKPCDDCNKSSSADFSDMDMHLLSSNNGNDGQTSSGYSYVLTAVGSSGYGNSGMIGSGVNGMIGSGYGNEVRTVIKIDDSIFGGPSENRANIGEPFESPFSHNSDKSFGIADQESVEEFLASSAEKEAYLETAFSEDLYAALDIVPDGDPIAFSLDGKEACTIRKEMGSHESTYWNFNLYATNPPIMLNMNRSLCDGTYILGIDRNDNGKLDSGYEIMWLRDFDAFQLLHNIDYYEGVHDGLFDANDPLWQDALVMDSDYNYHHPEDLGIKAISYYTDDMKRFADDMHGVGVYADEVSVSDGHFRIIVHAPTAIVLDDDTTTEAFGIVEGPLWDCTIHDVRYHIAEKMTGEYLRSDTPEDSTRLYQDALDFCDDFEAAHQNPDKYLSHWMAGIASMEHKKGLTDRDMLLQSKSTYEKALAMSPDNPFYNVDYCLVNSQLGLSTDECIPNVQRAIEDRPDVTWFQQVHVILTGNAHLP